MRRYPNLQILLSIPTTLVIVAVILSHFTLSWIPVSSAPPPDSYAWSNLDRNTLEARVTYTRIVYEYTASYQQLHYYYVCDHSDNVVVNWDYGILQIKYDNNQSPDGKDLKLYLDDVVKYQLGSGNWGSTDFKNVCETSKGSHTIRLSITVNSGGNTPSVTIRVVEKKTIIVHADEHSATCYRDADYATHTFKFTIPSESGTIIKVEWEAKWGNAFRTGEGDSSLRGKQMTVSFKAENFDRWYFRDSVVIGLHGSPPGVEPENGWSINAYYNEGADSVGLKNVAVAVSNGDLVGYRGAKYLVTDIQLSSLDITGDTGEGYRERSGTTFNVWANRGSEVRWKFVAEYYGVKDGIPQWCSFRTPERYYKGEECRVEGFQDICTASVNYTSKGKTSTLQLSLECRLNIHFDELKAIPAEACAVTHRGKIPLALKRPSETEAYVEVSKANELSLGIKTVDALGEFSKMDYYSLNSPGSGRRSYVFMPSSYKGITHMTNASITVRWIWFKLSAVVYGASRLSGDEYWVDCARGGATVEVYAQLEDTGEYAKGVSVFDCDGHTVKTDSSGKATFYYGDMDKVKYYHYFVVEYVYYDDYDGWSDAKSITIVYTRILLTTSISNAILFNGKYFAPNGTNVKLRVNAKYSHNGNPVSGANVYFFNLSRTTDSNGDVEFNICSNDEEISSRIYASKWVISGQTNPVTIVFTGVSLIPFRRDEPCYLIKGSPGESFDVVLKAYLTYNKSFIDEVDVRWVQGGIVKKTPAAFTLTMPQSRANMTFELVDFISCKPLNVVLIPKNVKLTLLSVENAMPRNGEYWNKSGSVIRVKLSVSFLYCNDSTRGMVVKDTEGNVAVADSNGVVGFSYNYSDHEISPVYTAYDNEGHALGSLRGPTIIFSRINLKASASNVVIFNGVYYASNGWNVNILLKASYSHNGKPVANATVSLLGLSSRTNGSGVASFVLSGSDEEYKDTAMASDRVVDGSTDLDLIFTDVELKPSNSIIKAAPGAKTSVTIYARLSYSDEYLSGLRVEWVQGGIVGETSTPFYVEIPSSPANATFRLLGFLPCPEVNVTLIPRTVKLSLEDVGASKRGMEYWAKSGSNVVVKLKAEYVYCSDPPTTITVTDGRSTKSANEKGFVEFSYSDGDKSLSLSFLAIDRGYALSGKINLTLVFTRIILGVKVDAVRFGDAWYGCNDADVSIAINATYAHNGASVPNCSIRYLDFSTRTDVNGAATFSLKGCQRKYDGLIVASDGVVDGNEKLTLVFTDVALESSSMIVEGFPGDDAAVTIRARLTYNGEFLSGLKVKLVEKNMVEDTPANFILKVPDKGSENATFILEGFLPCYRNVVVRVVSVNATLTARVNGTLRDSKYWLQSGLTAMVRLKPRLSSLNVSSTGMRIVDSYGNVALTDSNGTATFYYNAGDCIKTISYTLFSNSGRALDKVNVTLVFSRIIVEKEVRVAIPFNGVYYAGNGANVSIAIRARYSHDGSSAAYAKAGFFKYSETDSKGSAVISLSDRDREYDGNIVVSDGIVNGSTPLDIVFTDVRIESSSEVVAGAPGEDVSLILNVRLSYNGKTLNGLKIRWVEGNITRGTPANFTLRILDSPFNATFVLDDFLPCGPCKILVVPGVELSIVEVKGAARRGNEYWAQSNSTVTLTINVHYKNGGPAVGTIVNDSEGNRMVVPDGGSITFSYSGVDEAVKLCYTAMRNSRIIPGGLNITLVFTRIIVEVMSVEGINVGGEYWANSYSMLSVAAKLSYSHSGVPAAGASASLLGYSALANESGIIVIKVSGADGKYAGSVAASDGAIFGESTRLSFLFTRILLNVTREGNAVNVKAVWAHSLMPVSNLRVKVFETNQVGITDLEGKVMFIVRGVGGELLVYALDRPNGIYARETVVSL
ncbi:MAG: hypothetical protein HA496_01010 [Thaumarchaeota archaeon]|nr:hypothetical protein [Nitrososphaerota archaeon]